MEFVFPTYINLIIILLPLNLFIFTFYLFILENLGIGDWGLGIGDWGLGPIPNPQSPIPIVYNIILFIVYCLLCCIILYCIYLLIVFNNHIK